MSELWKADFLIKLVFLSEYVISKLVTCSLIKT